MTQGTEPPPPARQDGPDIAMPVLDYQPADYIGVPSTDALHNLTLEYTYSNGHRYRLMFNDSFGVSFQMLDDGSEARGPVPYRCRGLREQQFLVHWQVRQFGVHVALVIDLMEEKINVGALMPPGSWEFFDESVDVKVVE